LELFEVGKVEERDALLIELPDLERVIIIVFSLGLFGVVIHHQSVCAYSWGPRKKKERVTNKYFLNW
jgi:hypothetical protein